MIEAAISIWAGVDAESIALISFGLDSVIESAAASALLYRVAIELTTRQGNRSSSSCCSSSSSRDAAVVVTEVDDDDDDNNGGIERTERFVGRFVGVTFLLLAAYVTAQSVWVLSTAHGTPEESLVGIVVAAASLVVMPLVAWGKIRAAREIGSKSLHAEAKETLACCYLSFALLLGLGANALFGWWWADPVAALIMVPWLVKEGLEGVGCLGDDD